MASVQLVSSSYVRAIASRTCGSNGELVALSAKRRVKLAGRGRVLFLADGLPREQQRAVGVEAARIPRQQLGQGVGRGGQVAIGHPGLYGSGKGRVQIDWSPTCGNRANFSKMAL